MIERDTLDRWIETLRGRVASGGLAGVGPIDLGDGTGGMPGERLVMIMLADLDDLDDPDGGWRLDGNREERRRALLDDFRRLRALLG